MGLRAVDQLLGNVADAVWAARLADATVDTLALDQWQAQRSRLRTTTLAGVELAISLDRSVHLRDGDVLDWDAPSRTAIVARIDLKPVMIVHLEGLLALDAEVIGRTCVELGHAIGNQHWPAVVKGTRVYVPLTVDHAVMSSVMQTHAFEGIHYEFVPAAEVIPYLAPHESRRLFGAAEIPGHHHDHDL
jgi:urease accessory protein